MGVPYGTTVIGIREVVLGGYEVTVGASPQRPPLVHGSASTAEAAIEQALRLSLTYDDDERPYTYDEPTMALLEEYANYDLPTDSRREYPLEGLR